MKYAKALVAIAGSTATAALAIVPPHSVAWQVLTILTAALTASGVYLVPNKPAA